MGKDRFLAGVSGRAAVKRTLWVLAATAAGSGLLCAAVCLLEAKAAPGQARLYIAGRWGVHWRDAWSAHRYGLWPA